MTRRIISTLPLVFTFQACKSMFRWFLHPAWKPGSSGCYKFPHPSISPSFSLSVCLSFFSLHVQDRNNMEEISCTAQRRRGVGWEGKKRWRGGGWAGVQSLKISQTAERKAGPQQSRQHTFSFSYFCCFFHNIWSLPYKLMTTKVLKLRHKKTRQVCHSNFPSRLPAALLSVKSALNFYRHNLWVFRSQVSKGKRLLHLHLRNSHIAAVPSRRPVNPTASGSCDLDLSEKEGKWPKSVFPQVIEYSS